MYVDINLKPTHFTAVQPSSTDDATCVGPPFILINPTPFTQQTNLSDPERGFLPSTTSFHLHTGEAARPPLRGGMVWQDTSFDVYVHRK